MTPPALTTPPFCPILIHRLNLGLSHRRKTHGLYSGGDGAAAGWPASTIRYYDKEGLLPFVGRSSGGIRVFTEKDFEWLRIIECLKKTGMSLKDIREYIELAMQGDETIARRLELFRKQRTVLETRMAELQQTMDTLDYKCWFYETAAARGSTEGISDLPDEALPEALRPVRERLRAAAEAETEEV